MTRKWLSRERGAVLVHVAVAMLGFLGFSALVIDYGIMWSSRRQAQNVADAAALAASITMAYDAPGDYDRARATAKRVGETHKIFNLSPTITQGSGSNADITQDISFPPCPPGLDGPTDTCVRVNVYRNVVKDVLPTFFAGVFGVFSQGVKATATSQIAVGNRIECLLPFAVIDRWADDFDDKVDTTYFADDGKTGIDGWTANDDYQPTASPADFYNPPYKSGELPGTNGFTVQTDYGRQLILKDGSPGNYSAGWANEIDLPDSTGSKDYKWNIKNCNEQPVGIAKFSNPCTAVDEPNGCVSVKTGVSQGPTSQGVNDVVAYDPLAKWNWSLQGGKGGIEGGNGGTRRIRPIVLLDINHYIAQGCSGTTCIGKVANIIGFFLEGMCKDVTLDLGLACNDPSKDVVGRIVKVPSTAFAGAGDIEDDAAFLTIIRLVR